LDWDHYSYIRENLVSDWNIPTAILYGSDDDVTAWNELAAFSEKYSATVKVHDHGEHYFHTEVQLRVFDAWADENLL
jgi:hypothetical protein